MNRRIIDGFSQSHMAMTMITRRNPKGDGGKGTGQKKMSRQFATNVKTIYDIFRNMRLLILSPWLPAQMAYLQRRPADFTKPRPRDSLARHGDSSELPLQCLWDRTSGTRLLPNSPLMRINRGPLSERTSHLNGGYPLPGSMIRPFPSLIKQGG